MAETTDTSSVVVAPPKKTHYFRTFKEYIVSTVAFYFLVVAAYFSSYFVFFGTFKNAFYNRSLFGAFTTPVKRHLPPKPLADKIYGTHSYLQISDVKLHFLQKGDAGKPLLLLLHDSPDFWFSFRQQIDHFSQCYWVIAVDLRGSGDSEKPSGTFSYKLDYLAEDVKNLIQSLGREKAVIISHGFGGTILYQFLLKYPEFVEKYVTISSPPPYAIKLSIKQIIKYWFQYFSIVPYFPEFYLRQYDLYHFQQLYFSESKDIIDAYKFAFGKPGALNYAVNYYRANVLTLIFYWFAGISELEKKKLPQGLVLYGEKDAFNTVHAFKNAHKVPNVQVEKVVEGDYLLHQKQSKIVNEIIGTFLGLNAT